MIRVGATSHFKVENSNQTDYTKLKMKRRQIYFGSKNVPYYIGETTLKSESNNLISWRWYDSETDQNLEVESNIPSFKIDSISHDENTVLDTLQGDTLEIALKNKLKKNESLSISIYKKSFTGASSLYYKFKKTDSRNQRTFNISSKKLRDDSNALNLLKKKKTKKKYGNLEVEVNTEKSVPVLTSGRNVYNLVIKINKSQTTNSAVIFAIN